MLKVLDLFSGIGGFSLGLERAGMETVAFCEIDQFCQQVLKKHWPNIPCYGDIIKLNAEQLRNDGIQVDLICGGFPCQDLSVANHKGKGIKGERSGLWNEYYRLICELRPKYVIVENVANLLRFGIGDILGQLSEIGYDAEWHIISAATVGAVHKRERLWISAYPKSFGGAGGRRESGIVKQELDAHIKNNGYSIWREASMRVLYAVRNPETAPCDLRNDYGFSDWTHRIRALGNAIVPQIAEILGRAILEDYTKCLATQ